MKQSLLSSWCGVTTTLAKTVGSPSARRRGTMLKPLFLAMLFLIAGVGNVWGADATMTAGTNGSSASVSGADAIKVGTNKKGGTMTITVPSGANVLHLKAAAWNGVSGLSLNITPTNKVETTSIALTANSGISGNSPFTFSGDVTSSYMFDIPLTSISTSTTLTFTSSAEKRFVVWGAKVCYNPTSLTSSNITSSSAHVSWTDSHDVNSYDVYWSTSNTAPAANATPTATVTNKYADLTGLNAGTTYYWWVRAKDGDCKTNWIAGSSFTTTAAAFTITAQSNNTSYGTVSGTTTITASPKSGYRVSTSNPYSVSPANSAAVSQNGNVFTVTPSANTTITINFEEIPSHNIIFNTGGLVSIANASAKEGETYNIPNSAKTTVEGALTENCEYGTFVGWTTASSIASASVCPSLVTSVTMSTSNINLYAVYSKTESSGSTTTNTVTETFANQTSHSSENNWQQELSWPTSESNASIAWTTYFGKITSGYTEIRTYSNGTMGWLCSGAITGLKKVKFKGWHVNADDAADMVVSYSTNGGTSWTELGTHTATENNSSESDEYEITNSNPSTSYLLKIALSDATCPSSSNKKYRIDDIVITTESAAPDVTTYSLDANCCNPLGSINGSFTVNQNVVVNGTDITVSLVADNLVEGAEGYRFVLYSNAATPAEITHKDVNKTSNVSCTFGSSDDITVGTTYKVSVITLGDGSTNCAVGGESSKIAVEVPNLSVWTVSYDANTTDDVTGMPAAGTQILQTAGTGNLSDATPARTGYTFVGWSDESGANNTKNYNAGGSITITGDKTVYAVWTATNYSVTMAKSPAAAANDEAVIVSVNKSSNNHYGDQITVSVTAHPGYVFTGWSADPSVTFANASAESTTFSMPASDVTVTASFAPVLSTMAEIQGAAESEKKNVNISITDWIVTARSNNGNQVWMTAENNTKGIILYKSGNNFAVGNKLNGVVQNTELQLYQGYAELLSLINTDVTIAEGTFDVTPRTTTLEALYSNSNLYKENGTVVKLVGLTYSSSNTNYSDGTRTIEIDNKMNISLNTIPTNGEKYTLSGAVEYTQKNNQFVIKIIPRSAGDLALLTCDVNPTLGATSVDQIGEEGVTLKSAGISAIGDYCEISSYGFEYSTSSNFANATHVEVGTTYTTANTAFQKVIASGLTPSTTYYVRAYATNGHGTAYSVLDGGFTTLASTAKVISITPATSHDFEQVLTTASAQTWTFNVKGANLDENVVITGASAPITLSSSSLAYASVNGENGVNVTVTLTPNGAANVNQTLTLTSGTASATVTIQASVVAPYEVTFSVPTGLTAPQVQSVTPGQAANLNVTPTGSLAECTFLGWVSAQHAVEQVEAIDPLESYTPTGNATLYALFKRADTEDKEGYALSVVYSNNTCYVGEYNSSKKNFSIASALADAEVFFFDEAGYIYAYNNGEKSYLKSTGTSSSSKADVGFAAKENSASWTISEGNPCTITANSGQTGRLFAYNHNNGTPRFAAYSNDAGNSYVYNITKTAATKEVGTNYYSTAPVVATLTSIEVTTEPTKTDYFAGDDFDATGMVVKAHFSGGKADKTIKHSDLTISPSTNLTAEMTSVSISYGGQSTTQAITVTAIALTSINITGPTNTTYTEGDQFSTEGLVVNAVFNDITKNRALEANEYEVSPPNMNTLGAQTVTVSFTFAGTTKTAEFTIQVNSALQSISANTDNVKMTYIESEAFDPEGLVITATYAGSSSHAVTGYTIAPTGALKTIGELTEETEVEITISYSENNGTPVETSFNVTVQPYPKRTVTFSINGNTETSATETEAQGGIAKPSDPAGVGEYEFAGWSKTPRAVESIADPELVEWPYYPENDETLYAVYSHDAEAEIHGMYLTAEVDANHTEKTIGYYDSNSLYPTDDGDHQSPLALWFQDGLLFYINGTNRTYVYNTSGDAKITINTTKSYAEGNLWEKLNNEDGTITFKRSDSRYLAWNASYFRAYASNTYPFNKFTATQATETIVETVPYYTTSPSADVTPELSFNEENPSINVLDGDGNLNTYLNTLNKGGSTGSVSYVSGDETVATVDENGTVTAVKGGTVTITANVAAVPGSYKAASKSYTLTINKMTASASFGTPATSDVYVGNTIALPATSGDAITITYSSSNTSYATVDAAGNVTGVSADGQNYRSITVYAEWAATDIYEASTNSTRAKITVKVYDNAKTQTLSFADAEKLFTPQSGDQTYTNVLSGAVTGVTYASNNTTFAEVDAATGEVTIHTNVDGSATITATAAADDVTEGGIIYHYAQAQASYVISLDYPRPTISIESCDIKAPISVEITSDEPTILYTLDGTTPSYSNGHGETYESALAISETTTLRAIAVSNTGAESPVATATYTKVLPTVTCNVADGGSVPAGAGAVVLTAAEDALITYELVNSVNTVLASGTDVHAPINLDVTMGSGYTLTILSQWDCENGFSTDKEITFNATGAGYLPIYYNDNKTYLPVYFTPSSGMGNYDSAEKTKIKFGNSGQNLVVQFANEPAKLSYTLKLNGSGTDYVFKVEESEDGTNYSTLREHTSSTYALTSNEETTFSNIDLASTTRYIRWTYTTKPTGSNIGLGNITITASNTGSITIDGVNVTELPDGFQGNVTVVNGGTMNVSEAKTLTNLTVEAGGKVTGSAALNVQDLTINSEYSKSGQVMNENVTVNGDLFIEIKLCESAMNAEASRKWYCISTPFNVNMNGGFFWGDGTPMVLNTDFQLFEWDGDRRATGISGWKRVSGVMKAGIAYFIGFDDERSNQNIIKLKATNKSISNKSKINAPEHSSSVDDRYANWNGLANPNFHYIALDKDVQAFDHSAQGYNPYESGEYNFVVGTPFFIKETGDITIEAADNGAFRAPKREVEQLSYCVRIARDGKAGFDNQMYVRASEEASASYEEGHDLVTMNNETSNYGALLWTVNYGGKRMAIEEAPLVNNKAVYALSLYAPATGIYRIETPTTRMNADLYLTYEGSIIWNLSEGAYPVDLKKGTTEGYGLLLNAKMPQTPTGVDNVQSDKVQCTKVILDEKVFILRGGQMYDVTGKAVR